MANAVAGHTGSVLVGALTVALVDQWQAQLSQAMYDSTQLGDSSTSDTPGLLTLTGTLSGSWDVISDAGQKALHDALLTGGRLSDPGLESGAGLLSSGAVVSLKLETDGTHGYSLSALIGQFDTTVPKSGLVGFQCAFRSFGVVTVL